MSMFEELGKGIARNIGDGLGEMAKDQVKNLPLHIERLKMQSLNNQGESLPQKMGEALAFTSSNSSAKCKLAYETGKRDALENMPPRYDRGEILDSNVEDAGLNPYQEYFRGYDEGKVILQEREARKESGKTTTALLSKAGLTAGAVGLAYVSRNKKGEFNWPVVTIGGVALIAIWLWK